MKNSRAPYRKNYFLIVAFATVLTASLVVALILAINMTTNKVESEFSSRKGEVLEYNLLSFNDFFQNKIPEISFYQGYLDSATASILGDTILKNYPFVDKIMFYDVVLNNHMTSQYGYTYNNLIIYPTGIFEFSLVSDAVQVQAVDSLNQESEFKPTERSFSHSRKQHSSFLLDDFNHMAYKFASFIERVDTANVVFTDIAFQVFYSVTPGKISYMNIPRKDDLRAYKDLMEDNFAQASSYEHDLLTFFIDPNRLDLANPVPELYQHIEIQPLVYDHINLNPNLLVTETPMPGAMSDHKLVLSSSSAFLSAEINQRLYPVLGGILLIYLFLIMFAYLIYRNLYINNRMYKLQYDFINNLTHEFKTPVSVIKIAGNNIGSAKQLSDQERAMYSKILDVESDKLNNLMNTLLSFTQIENKSIKLKKSFVDLNEFCERFEAATRLKFPDLQLSWRVDTEEPIFTDPVLLGSIFQNLTDNAYKYSKAGERNLKIHIFRKKKNFVMTFLDQGIGIAKSELEHVFKKFYRVQSQYNQQGSIGLGLAFCKELVNFMGGTIEADSELGKGTVFTIHLPME